MPTTDASLMILKDIQYEPISQFGQRTEMSLAHVTLHLRKRNNDIYLIVVPLVAKQIGGAAVAEIFVIEQRTFD